MSDYGQGGGFGPQGGGGFGPQGGGDQPMNAIPFDTAETANLGTMATFMFIAGIISILSAVLGLIAAVTGVVGTGLPAGQMVGNVCGGVLGALASAALGIWLIIGAGAFRRVIQSDEADQAHLANGLKQLRNVFLLKSILIILAIVAFCLMAVFGAAMAGSAGGGDFGGAGYGGGADYGGY